MHALAKINKHWSSNLAYAIGLLATDGNLSKDGRHINLTSKDYSQIKTFKNCLGLKAKIGKKASGSQPIKKYYQVQFGDIIFYRWLVNIGLHANKSKTLGRLLIPKTYYFDFLRGCFDGDGSIFSYWDPRWKSSYMFYLQLASTSRGFLKWLQSMNKQLANVNGKISTSTRVLQLKYAKKETKILISKMYYDQNLPYLKRKFNKINYILHTDRNH